MKENKAKSKMQTKTLPSKASRFPAAAMPLPIMRRVLFSCFFMAVVYWTPSAWAADKTNVILIVADDIGYECYGACGGTSYKTPILDKMAKEGMRFEHAYSNPVCAPSRVKIMTGLSNVRNYAAFSILKKSEKTIGNMMKDAGYRTAIAGKWQLLGTDHYPEGIRGQGSWPKDTGFERHCLWQVDKGGKRYWRPAITIDGKMELFPKDVYGPDVYSRFLMDRMEEYKDEPFFLYYPHGAHALGLRPDQGRP